MADRKFATLGSVVFGLLPMESFEERYSYDYAEHRVIEGKPRLQFIGDNLDETTIGIRLHVSFCDPEAAFRQLKSEADKHQALPLTFADGTSVGKRVITEITKTTVVTADNGRPILIEARLTLKEFWDGAPLESLQAAQKASAPGLAGEGPIAKAAAAPTNQKAVVSGQIKAQAAQIKRDASLMTTLVGMLSSAAVSVMAVVGPIIAQIKQLASSIMDKLGPILQQAKELATNAKAAAGVVQGYAQQIQGYATTISGLSSQLTRITSGLPAPLNKVGSRIAAVNSRISAQSTKTITLASLVQGDSIEAQTRALMIVRMLPQ